jgi:hypothetical protein
MALSSQRRENMKPINPFKLLTPAELRQRIQAGMRRAAEKKAA